MLRASRIGGRAPRTVSSPFPKQPQAPKEGHLGTGKGPSVCRAAPQAPEGQEVRASSFSWSAHLSLKKCHLGCKAPSEAFQECARPGWLLRGELGEKGGEPARECG